MLFVSHKLFQTYVLPFQETEEPIEFSPKSVAEYLMRTGETDEFQGLLNDLVEASEVSTMPCAKQLQRNALVIVGGFLCVLVVACTVLNNRVLLWAILLMVFMLF